MPRPMDWLVTVDAKATRNGIARWISQRISQRLGPSECLPVSHCATGRSETRMGEEVLFCGLFTAHATGTVFCRQTLYTLYSTVLGMQHPTVPGL